MGLYYVRIWVLIFRIKYDRSTDIVVYGRTYHLCVNDFYVMEQTVLSNMTWLLYYACPLLFGYAEHSMYIMTYIGISDVE
jgi:hypothetical protein